MIVRAPLSDILLESKGNHTMACDFGADMYTAVVDVSSSSGPDSHCCLVCSVDCRILIFAGGQRAFYQHRLTISDVTIKYGGL